MAPAYSTAFWQLPTFAKTGDLQVIIDTPQHSRNKFKYEPALGLFKLQHVLAAGLAFPYDFGYLPSTQGEDGDPLDALVLNDAPTFVGCLVPARVIGVLEAEQTQEGPTFRNDRLLAVAVESHLYRAVKTLEQLNPALVDELEHFFVAYNIMRGRIFKPQARAGVTRAQQLIEAGMQGFRDSGQQAA